MAPLAEFYWNEGPKGLLRSFAKSGHFPHGILLEGRPGVGKRTFARLIAAAAFCRGGGEHPCGVCPACHKVFAGNHPDLIFLGEEGGVRSFHIDVIRQLRQSAQVMPNEADYKVAVLCGAENMTVQAQNALLKLLEEPPSHSIFILTVQNRMSLLPTILSRLQVLSLEEPGVAACGAALEALRPGQPPALYQRAAAGGRGTLGGALSALEKLLAGESLSAAGDFLGAVLHEDEFRLLARLAPYERDREGLLLLLGELREETATLLTGKARENLPPDAPAFTTLQLVRIADIIEGIARQTAQNGNLPLLTTVLCSKLKSALNSMSGR